ncbi:MAG: hypothetical protein EOM24_09235, partial [Chloroflexia bacterium]|nr:hypothetical protein [Chloroflexia bacterium]
SPAVDSGPYRVRYTTRLSPNATTRLYQSVDGDSFLVPRSLGTTRRDIALELGGAISGRVSATASGEGLAGVAVVARVNGNVVGSVVTDNFGQYDLAGLPVGEVTLDVSTEATPLLTVRRYTSVFASATVTVVVGTTVEQDLQLDLVP